MPPLLNLPLPRPAPPKPPYRGRAQVFLFLLCWSQDISPAPLLLLVLSILESETERACFPRRRGRMGMVQQRKFRLSDMIPNAWFYKLRDMRPQGRGGVGIHRRSSWAGCYKEVLQRPPWNRGSSARWDVGEVDVQQPAEDRLNREVGVQQPVAEVIEPPNTPVKESCHSPLPRRASYYYSTRDREDPPPRRAMEAQSPTRRTRVGHASEGRRHVSAPAPVHEKEPVVDAPGSSCRRRDICIKDDSGEPRRPTVTGPPDDGLDVKVIASEKEIIIDLRDDDTPERRLRPIATKPATREPELNEPDGSRAVDFAEVTVWDEDEPERRLRPIVTRPARRLPEPNEPEGSHVDLTVTARASSVSEKSSVSKPRRSSVSSSSGRRRLKTRAHSPRLAATARRGKPMGRNWRAPAFAESYAVVKMSGDPRKDFLDSMEEMIAEKGIRHAADLEDLLACYLSLNDAEQHDLIIEVFEQVWMSLANAKP
uniref:Uncharacterized protein n=1 Tax=Avena sativa TaxID=4498 RepID=A0ACD5U2T2_AVESA